MKKAILLILCTWLTLMLQAQVSKTVNVTAGGLSAALTDEEKSTITNLTLTGTIDARDFKTMRDDMPVLAVLDLSNVVIIDQINVQNSIPSSAFYDYANSKGKKSLTTVVLPPTITRIGDEAFRACGIGSINFPPSLTRVGANAFRGCGLTVNIPSTLTWIGASAFLSCWTINVDANNPNYSSIDGVLFNKDQTTLIQCNLGSQNGLAYTIPSTVRTIGYYAFVGTENLTWLTMPNSVTTIEAYAFAGCRSLRELNGLGLNIPSSITSLGSYAFENCSGAPSVVVPSFIKNIPYACFRGCKFAYITIMSDVVTYDNQAFFVNAFPFYNDNRITVHSKHPAKINAETFGYDKYSYALYVPPGCSYEYSSSLYWKDFGKIREYTGFSLSEDKVTIGTTDGSTGSVSIFANTGWTATSDQSWLTVNPISGSDNQTLTFTAKANTSPKVRTAHVTVSAEGVASQIINVKQEASNFSNDLTITPGDLSSFFTYTDLDTITHLTLHGAIDARDFKAMRDDMPKLSHLNVNDVSIVSYTGTEGTDGISNTTYPENTIPNYAFYNPETYQGKANLRSLTLPLVLTSIGHDAFNGCSSFTSFIIPSTVSTIEPNTFSNCIGLKTVTIPSPINTVGSYAFMGCMNLESIEIPSSVTSIGAGAFMACSKLKTVVVPNSVISIGSNAFSQCQELTTVSLSSSISEISDGLFSFCSELSAVAIPASITRIGKGAFMGCSNLATIQLPKTINSIGGCVFMECNALISIISLNDTPIDLTFSSETFTGVDIVNSILYVPFGSKTAYQMANQWQDFKNIIEMPGFKLSTTTTNVGANSDSKAMVDIDANVAWTASSDQTWLSVNPATGSANQMLTFTASENTSVARTAKVTVSATGVPSQTITITQDASSNISQSIVLNTGWNIISANVVPTNLNLKDIFQPLIDAGKLKKVMDETGKTIENLGAFGGWRNNISNLNITKGYKVNVTASSTLSLEGAPVQLPFDMALNVGWNIISYPATSTQDAKALFQALIDGGKLKKVMDEAGKTIENLGAFGGWRNNIGNFIPGKGYKVNVTANCVLTIPANGNKSAVVIPELLASEHFKPVFTGNGTDHMNIHLVNLQGSGLQSGDEIGIFDGKLCVGSATIGAEQIMAGNISIPASASDELTKSVNGFKQGQSVELLLHRGTQTYKLSIEKLCGNDSFEKGGSLVAQANKDGLARVLFSENLSSIICYPNPFNQEITIKASNVGQDQVTVEIYNTSGQLIKFLYQGTNNRNLDLKWNGTNDQGQTIPPGIYLCKINGESKQIIFNGK